MLNGSQAKNKAVLATGAVANGGRLCQPASRYWHHINPPGYKESLTFLQKPCQPASLVYPRTIRHRLVLQVFEATVHQYQVKFNSL